MKYDKCAMDKYIREDPFYKIMIERSNAESYKKLIASTLRYQIYELQYNARELGNLILNALDKIISKIKGE